MSLRRAFYLAVLLYFTMPLTAFAQEEEALSDFLDDSLLGNGELLPRIETSQSDSPEPIPDPQAPVQTEDHEQKEAAAERAFTLQDIHFGQNLFESSSKYAESPARGPVPESYLLGIGDQLIIEAWGEVEFRIERTVDREGSILLPRGGKVPCHNRTLDQISRAVRKTLSRVYSGISTTPGKGSVSLDVSLGKLREIRVFVVGEASRPGALTLSSVSTIFSALYASGGPGPQGSYRDIQLIRDNRKVSTLDVYSYLVEGLREGDLSLREGDTIFIPPFHSRVQLTGEVRRPMTFELLPAEGLEDLLRFAGGFTAHAATEILKVDRILPPEDREAGKADRVRVDLALDPATKLPKGPEGLRLRDGDRILVEGVGERQENWVDIEGNVKRPGRYQYREGMDILSLIRLAGGLWGDTLEERALLERIDEDLQHHSINVNLGETLLGIRSPLPLLPMDRLRIFSIWDLQDRHDVSISGAVREPGSFEFMKGMTLRDLVLRAGGFSESADLLEAEVARLHLEGVQSRNLHNPPRSTVKLLKVSLGENWLSSSRPFILEAHDRVSIRKLPWWQLHQSVTLSGEVHYPGEYVLQRDGERLSELIERAGGLKPQAFAPGARMIRLKDDIGEIALDLERAMKRPGRGHDVILTAGDEISIPVTPHTVQVSGEVGFPTNITYVEGKSLAWYVSRAGGFNLKADKWRTRLVYANGVSRPIRRLFPDPPVLPGSIIVVPSKAPEEPRGKLDTMKELASIVSSLAMVWLVVNQTN